jgi:hypothetical protein
MLIPVCLPALLLLLLLQTASQSSLYQSVTCAWLRVWSPPRSWWEPWRH